MIVRELINQLEELIEHGMPENVEVIAYNGDEGKVVSVTGFLFDDKTIEICTDEP